MKLFKRQQPEASRRRNLERTPTVETRDSYTFRRGRTLTGSASSHVRTAGEFQADLKSSRVQIHELRRKRRRIGSVLVGTLSIVALLFALLSQFTAAPDSQPNTTPSTASAETPAAPKKKRTRSRKKKSSATPPQPETKESPKDSGNETTLQIR